MDYWFCLSKFCLNSAGDDRVSQRAWERKNKAGIEAPRPEWASPALEPIGDVVRQRADHAGSKRAPEDAEQQHGVRALHEVLVHEMGHGRPHSKFQLTPPFPTTAIYVRPPLARKACNGKPGLQCTRGSPSRLCRVYAEIAATVPKTGPAVASLRR